jgi:lysozyme
MNEELLVTELRRDEGVFYSKYYDPKGIPTIGVGHNMQSSPLPASWKQPLSDDQVDDLLNHDLSVVFAALDLHYPWWRKMDEVRQRVVANMCFNMGITKLSGFVNAMHCMSIGDYHGASAGMAASKWAVEVGHRAGRLIEAMNTGIMPS